MGKVRRVLGFMGVDRLAVSQCDFGSPHLGYHLRHLPEG